MYEKVHDFWFVIHQKDISKENKRYINFIFLENSSKIMI